MMMKSVFWWRKPEHPEETTDLRQVTDLGMHVIYVNIRNHGPVVSASLRLSPSRMHIESIGSVINMVISIIKIVILSLSTYMYVYFSVFIFDSLRR